MFAPRPLSPALTRFVECLAVTPYNWFVRPDGKLRAREHGRPMCALTGVARYRTGRTYSVGDWIHAGESIGLSPAEAALVVDASDHCHGAPRIQRLRHRLLKATLRTAEPASPADPAEALELTA